MDLGVIYFAAFVGLLAAVYLVRPNYLFSLWVILLFVFPTTRTYLGPAPVYWFDVATMIVCAMILSRPASIWPAGGIKWHWWFISYAFIFGLLIPSLRYSPTAESIYVWGHTSLAWMAFPIGVNIAYNIHYGSYRQIVIYSLMSVLTCLALLAVFQKGDGASALAVNEFYRGDMDGMWTESAYGIERYSHRPNGPYGAATTFAGVAMIVGLIVAVLNGSRRTWIIWLAAGLIAAVTLLTLTRHVLVAAVAGLCVAVLSSRAKNKAKLLFVGGVFAAAAALAGVSLGWGERVALTNGGVLSDISIASRLVVGPLRLFQYLVSDPVSLITGVGLDVQKLAASGVDVGAAASGFVSNGFLLSLYYLGVGGLALMVSFWGWIYLSTKRMAANRGSVVRGLVVVAVAVVAADNYAFLEESAVAGLFLFAGCVAGESFAFKRPAKRYAILSPRRVAPPRIPLGVP